MINRNEEMSLLFLDIQMREIKLNSMKRRLAELKNETKGENNGTKK